MIIKKIQYNIFGWLLLLGTIAAAEQLQPDARPLIVTSIKPLAIIAKSAVGDAAEVQYLMPAGQSPHDFTLPVSALRKIADADLVIWIGGGFEARSAKTMSKLSSDKLLTAMDLPLTQLQNPETSENDDHSMEADPHLWLNPDNGNKIAAEIQARLGLPPKEIINRQYLSRLKSELAAIDDKTYLSHHQAYAHFAAAFDLKPGLSIRNASGGAQGAKTQYRLRGSIEKTNVSCVFVEPQYQDKDAAIIAAEYGLPLVPLDPQGLSQSMSDRAYSEFIGTLVAQFKACFQ
jgi:zinc transport system substrate-binding protein